MGCVNIALVEGQDPAVEAVISLHHQAMRAASPEESCHVLTAAALRESGAELFALRDGSGEVAAVGALKPLDAVSVELKSMHVPDRMRGRGLGRVLLWRLLEEARASGAEKVLLETGSAPDFAAARGLYEAAGFTYCPPFGAYQPDPLSVFMELIL